MKNKQLVQGVINVTGEKSEIFGGKKYNDHKFPKRKRRIPYKSPVIGSYVMVEHDHGHRHFTTNKTSNKKGDRED